MFDIYMTRLHELTVVLYALCVLLYFIDFLHNNRKANRVAFWLLAFVWILQTVFLFLYMKNTGRFPVLTIFEGLYFYAWVLITLSLGINRLLRVDFIVFFTNVLGFVIMAIHTFAPVQYESEVMAQQLVSELLLIHITVAILSYGAFSLSFVFSLLYLIQYDLLKRKKWGSRLLRIADLSKLEHMSYVLNVIGVPMLIISLILGTQWAYIKVPDMHWYDAKVIGSFIVLGVYSVYLYVRVARGFSGKSLALWNLASFLIVLINFFLFGRLSSFHFWSS
ncbi:MULTISPECIES: cytochrome c biogenesis protein [Bacillaceae]|uniref:Cytochrome C n=2 Tax=Bacillus infantis TaxID=324767 RepID=U5LE99_9BACI|nr:MULTISPECIES: cytochrome c biogenesis protein [Bacillus]OXT18929.1 cytochrome C assembly protein [Bacillus sp. OG2]AGX05718.1 cytochrome C [Bacillus infantis NRRL B-14911]EAR65463.1 membrane-bound protein [Bacillus sp. NRRL B-14911]MCA1036425.1 cytochrome c biogenesis protein [Bacillus infantis]MCK6205001.1 cytochrome c biogenesis protein CcsA [Bacillus infantis]